MRSNDKPITAAKVRIHPKIARAVRVRQRAFPGGREWYVMLYAGGDHMPVGSLDGYATEGAARSDARFVRRMLAQLVEATCD